MRGGKLGNERVEGGDESVKKWGMWGWKVRDERVEKLGMRVESGE